MSSYANISETAGGHCFIHGKWYGGFQCPSCAGLPYGSAQPAALTEEWVREIVREEIRNAVLRGEIVGDDA